MADDRTRRDAGGGDRGETEDEKADRRYDELLQELRVAQTGVQFLFAFLLTLAFTQRFAQISDAQTWLYVGTLLVTAAASALLIGPVPLHRILFARGLKPRLVRGADAMARAGLVMLLLGINGAVLLILDVVLGGVLPFVLSGVTTLFFVLVWGIYPLSVRERPGG
jgi:hypothetical protein